MSTDALARQALAQMAGYQFLGDRDIDTNLGYTKDPKYAEFRAKYDRRDVASTIVDAPAMTTWRNPPLISDDSAGASEFMKEWVKLQRRLRIFHYFERVDRLAGIGRYAVLLIGAADGNLKTELTSVGKPENIIFLSPYSEKDAAIGTWDKEAKSARFGRPETYKINVTGDMGSVSATGTESVHWSRVIHVAEGVLDNEVYGEPRLQKVFNRLEDLDKIVGSSAEAFWQMVIKKVILTGKDDYELDDDVVDAIKDDWQAMLHNLQRVLAMEGIDFQEVGATPSDPGPTFDVVMKLVSGKTRMPLRILLGSERGDLASSQDQAEWLGRISERQEQFAEPMIIRPFVDRLIGAGALTAPQGGEYSVTWPPLFYLTEAEQAEVALKRCQAMKEVTGGFVADYFSKEEIRQAAGAPATTEEEKLAFNALDEDDPEVAGMFQRLRRARRVHADRP